MEDLSALFYVLLFLGLFLVLITVIGHGIWLVISWLVRQVVKIDAAVESPVQTLGISPRCANCNFVFVSRADFCGRCGAPRPSGIVSELLKDLGATLRQVERFRRSGTLDETTYKRLKDQLEAERSRLTQRGAISPLTPSRSESEEPRQPHSDPSAVPQPPIPAQTPSVVTFSPITTADEIVVEPHPVPSPTWTADETPPHSRPSFASSGSEPGKSELPPPAPRKPFAEVLAAFMEQSNIRWGEIIGGLLIIGCSTALVVSLWAQISSIPVLKFLIFTTVTAALFGVGLYTEHRWKLPTTSRGILTIATLLVPLNFLAIAAVSGSTGALVIGSELIAPALFLCLVYFAGRVLTPKWPHLLAVAVLGSSVGQLLIRHFASTQSSPSLLVTLGAFPVACYVAATAWKLKIAMADDVIDETETNAIFVTLGAATFAALLPFGLLLYKTGPVSMTMMYLAPLVTLAGLPLLASGTLLWRRVLAKELAASRTAGTSVAIIGTMVVLSGMILSWPNPASIVPAALFNFAVFTALALLLEIPVAHLFAAGCLALAYLVLVHVLMGHVSWQNLRVVSLLDVMDNVSTGQALLPLFVLLLGVSEWLERRKRKHDGTCYLAASCALAVVSLIFVTRYGFYLSGDPHGAWFFYLLYAIGGLWVAWRRQVAAFAWIGSALLLVACAQVMVERLEIAFPWQAALLAEASVCAAAAIVLARYESARKTLSLPLNAAALITSFLAIWALLFSASWEPTAMLAQDVFWLAAVWLVLLWLNRTRELFTAFQVALTIGLIVAIKASLQQYDWYTYHGSLHPWSLQIQGIALLLLSLGWIALRFFLSDKLQFDDQVDVHEPNKTRRSQAGAPASDNWLNAARRLLDARFCFDRFVLWSILIGFVMFTIYGALSGVRQELTALDGSTAVWNIGGFPHQYALGLASWILLGLLVIAMLANVWQRRRAVYLLGTVSALVTVCPLLAGWWETQIATASAWRFAAALFLVAASVPLWFRERWRPTNFSLSWSDGTDNLKAGAEDRQESFHDSHRQAQAYRTLVQRIRVLLLGATLTPLLLLTIYPALRAVYYMPVHGPAGGLFYWLGDTLSYGIPVVIAALALVAYALRERFVAYTFAAGLLFNLTVTMAYLLTVVAVHGSMDRVVSVHVIQLNAITAAVYALVWLSWRRMWVRKLSEGLAAQAEEFLKLHITLAVAANALVVVPVALRLAAEPGAVGIGTFAAGRPIGWLAFGLTTIAVFRFSAVYSRAISAFSPAAVFFGAGCLAAFSVAHWDPSRWSGFHVLTSAAAVTAWLMCLLRSLPLLVERRVGPVSDLLERPGRPQLKKSWPRESTLVASALGALAVLLSLRGVTDDPTGSWWSIGILFSMSGLAAALNWQTLQRAYLYAAGLLFSVATSIWWLNHWAVNDLDTTRFLEANVIAGSVSSIGWLMLELRARRRLQSKSTASSFHNIAALASLVTIGSIVLLRLVPYSYLGPPYSLLVHPGAPTYSTWLALSSLFALIIACLWDQHAKYSVAGLYLTGLFGVGMALSQLNLSPARLGWAVMSVLAVYAIATRLVWRWREN